MTDYRRRAMNRIDRAAFSEDIVLVEADTRPKRGRHGAEGESVWWVTYADGRRIGGVLSRKLPKHMRVDGWRADWTFAEKLAATGHVKSIRISGGVTGQ